MATAKKSAAKKSAAKKITAKKSSASKRTTSGSAKRSSNPSSTGQCWPGYEPVPGKAKGTKGSCKPKPNQTGAEKKSDSMAAAASKLHKAGGNKAKANHAK